MNTYIITGGGRGLGLAMAKHLARFPASEVVLGVRDMDQGTRAAAQIPGNVSARQVDMSSAESIARFIENWDRPLAGLINNAGVQILGPTRRLPEQGFEETFAVNHLYALKLTAGLLPYLTGGRVLFIGSGTHNPKNRTATIFGFRGAQFKSIKECADGLNFCENPNQAGMDRYATSKFLNMASTVELARRIPARRTGFYCLDPGLMAGTGLARTAPGYQQFAWKHILPIVSRFMPDSSTTEKSGRAGAWLMTADPGALINGVIYSYDKKPSTRVWEKVTDPDIGRRVLDESLALLEIDPVGLLMPGGNKG